MIDSVIFDMDGLMFDTERVWATLWEPALATLGLSYKEGLDVAARGTAGAVHGMVVENDAVSVACKGRVEFDIGIALCKSRLKGRQGVFGKFCGHAAVCFKNHGESLFCS